METENTFAEEPLPVQEEQQPETFITDDDVFATAELPVPPAIPDAHRATIEGVELKRYDNEKGTVSVVVNLRSLDVPTLETNYEVFLPKGFAENTDVNPTELPEEEGNKQQSSYRIGVSNSDGTASLQQLRALAKESGRTAAAVGITKKYTNIDEFADNHSKLLSGLEVVFFRRPDGGDDPRFKNRLKVKGIVSIAELNNAKSFLYKAKKGKANYSRAWEQQS